MGMISLDELNVSAFSKKKNIAAESLTWSKWLATQPSSPLVKSTKKA